MLFDTVVFDFDGTVADTAAGIFESIQYALKKLELPPADVQTLRSFIGPPLIYSFQEYAGLSQEQAEQAVVFYRENYSAGGKYKLTFYPGISEVMHTLRANHVHTCLASAKPDYFIQQILQHYHALDWFDHALGMSLQEQSADKSGVIREVISRCGNASKDRVLMVGDTKFDVRGAKSLGIRSMGVLYGYGSRAELEAENADFLVNSPEEILKAVLCL